MAVTNGENLDIPPAFGGDALGRFQFEDISELEPVERVAAERRRYVEVFAAGQGAGREADPDGR